MRKLKEMRKGEDVEWRKDGGGEFMRKIWKEEEGEQERGTH
jgi:hypothetical protein